ncbi:MAG TPA: hypothetical protein VH482_00165 [Thermomicrobiales bacterium]|jgi:hypothetical protein
MTEQREHVQPAPAKPAFRARLSILLIGGVALLGLVLMCVVVLVLATRM